MAKLEEVSGMTKESAKQIIIQEVTDEAKVDAAKIAKQIEDSAKDEAEKKQRTLSLLLFKNVLPTTAVKQQFLLCHLPTKR